MKQERRTEISGLTGSRRLFLFAVAIGLWLSGALWLLFHFFIQKDTGFGPRPLPIQHWWLILHGAFAFGALWLMGLLWGVHIPRLWRARRHRLSGSALFGALIILSASGYLLYYYAGDDDVRDLISRTHWILGLAALLPFFIHWRLRRRQ
jgi:cytochrome bd-type quinol oxidase subunit 1